MKAFSMSVIVFHTIFNVLLLL